MKLTQKVDHFTVFESCCSQKFLPNKIEKIGWLGMQDSRDVYIGWMVGNGLVGKCYSSNCDRALVKPQNQPGGFLMAEMKHHLHCGHL